MKRGLWFIVAFAMLVTTAAGADDVAQAVMDGVREQARISWMGPIMVIKFHEYEYTFPDDIDARYKRLREIAQADRDLSGEERMILFEDPSGKEIATYGPDEGVKLLDDGFRRRPYRRRR